jgi:hypothetical protein
MSHTHIIDGKFQSDRYPTAPPDTVPMLLTDPRWQDLIWIYAERWRSLDAHFADELQAHLIRHGFDPSTLRLTP